ncbi:MAG: hypothetical protein QXE05_01130 [Nitrososphaeria archaeon]
MYNIIKKLKAKEKNFLILAFLIPLTVRTIPEILSWPYPTGFDSLMYVNAMLKGYPFNKPILALFKDPFLFYMLAWLMNFIVGDLLITMKLIGIIIFSFFCLALYGYARVALKWNYSKSLMLSVLAGSYFVSLGMSWQMYRMSLGLAFFILALAVVRLKLFRFKIISITTLCILTVLSHDIAALILFILLTLVFFTKQEVGIKEMMATTPSIFLFIYQHYNPITGEVLIPTYAYQSVSTIYSFLYITCSLFYMFLPIGPIIILGLRKYKHNTDILYLSLICLLFIYMPVYSPSAPYAGHWYRWALLLACPIFFYSVEGLDLLWNVGDKTCKKLKIGHILAVTILVVNFLMTICYVTILPESQILYFGEWNNYKQFIPTSMLQNSVSLRDTPNVIEALTWIESNFNHDKVTLVLHEAMDNWAGITIGETIEHIRIDEVIISSPIRKNTSERLLEVAETEYVKGKDVYTIWWVAGKGWYNMPKLPEQFIEIKHFNNIAVYKYVS